MKINFTCIYNGQFFYSTKPPDDDNRTDNVHIAEFVNVTSNPVNWTEMPTKFPGQFASHRYCLAGVTQRHMYYVFLVSIILIFIMVSLVPSFSVLATCRKIPLKTLYDFTWDKATILKLMIISNLPYFF